MLCRLGLSHSAANPLLPFDASEKPEPGFRCRECYKAFGTRAALLNPGLEVELKEVNFVDVMNPELGLLKYEPAVYCFERRKASYIEGLCKMC